MGGFCLVELHREGSASAACAAGLFITRINMMIFSPYVLSFYYSDQGWVEEGGGPTTNYLVIF